MANNNNTTPVQTFKLLGSSGLRVFPLALGTGHFGNGDNFSQMVRFYSQCGVTLI